MRFNKFSARSGVLRLDMIEATELNKDCPDGCEFNVLCRGGRRLELKAESSADCARWIAELSRSKQVPSNWWKPFLNFLCGIVCLQLNPSAASHPSELNELNQEEKFWKPNVIQVQRTEYTLTYSLSLYGALLRK